MELALPFRFLEQGGGEIDLLADGELPLWPGRAASTPPACHCFCQSCADWCLTFSTRAISLDP
jgi:hypothetical protein